MALRDTVKSSRAGTSKTRAAVKSRSSSTPKSQPAAEQPMPMIQQPIPAIPEVFDYVRSMARIPGLRKTNQQ